MGQRSMETCIEEQLDHLREAVRLSPPCGYTLQQWYEDGADFEALGDMEPDQRETVTFAWGYLSGVADQLDLTVLEMLDAYGLSFDPRPVLAPSSCKPLPPFPAKDQTETLAQAQEGALDCNHIQPAWPAKEIAMRDKKKTDKPIRCAVCGSPEVQYAVWHSPNTGEVHDLFGSWNAGDNTFCATCDIEGRDPNPDLADPGDTDAYRDAERAWKQRRKATALAFAKGISRR